MVVIKKTMPMPAFQLGAADPMEEQLTAAGILLPLPEGMWRIKTREAKEEGELAKTGDYIKFDSAGAPYPTQKDWFEANHTRTADGMYLQTAHPRKAWCTEERMCPEMKFLVDKDLLQWDHREGFQATLWGTLQTAGPDAVVVFDRVETDNQGEILSVDFHFVAADEFAVSYTIISQ